MENSKLEILFPLPSPPPSTACPARLPGTTHETSVAATKILRANHVQRHGFVNDFGFHNHVSHQVLAVYALGGTAPLYDAIFKTLEPVTRAYAKSPGKITKANFSEHLGEKSTYYDAYLQYFHAVVLEKGATAAVEEYIFSQEVNSSASGALASGMLSRFYARIYHPLIYVGYGLEFGLLGMVAEGLAQAACHPIEAAKLFPESDFENVPAAAPAKTVAQVTEKLSTLLLNTPPSQQAKPAPPSASSGRGVHAFELAARILKDDRFSASALGLTPHEVPQEGLKRYEHVVDTLGPEFLRLAGEWLPDSDSADLDLHAKVEETSWLCALLYGVGGLRASGGFIPDFYEMHVLTSSLFLPPFIAYLSPRASAILLRKHLATGLAWWVARGRPALDIRAFYAHTPPPAPSPAAPLPQPSLVPRETPPNEWLGLVQGALLHTDDHFVKAQRTLLHLATVYGERAPGTFDGALLEGAEILDGSLFVRVAQLTAASMAGEGAFWEFTGFFV